MSKKSPLKEGNTQNLITTQELIILAKNAGIKFGFGDPKNRIRYFIKSGLLPKQIRRYENDEYISYISKDALDLLIRIQELTRAGVKVSEIKRRGLLKDVKPQLEDGISTSPVVINFNYPYLLEAPKQKVEPIVPIAGKLNTENSQSLVPMVARKSFDIVRLVDIIPVLALGKVSDGVAVPVVIEEPVVVSAQSFVEQNPEEIDISEWVKFNNIEPELDLNEIEDSEEFAYIDSVDVVDKSKSTSPVIVLSYLAAILLFLGYNFILFPDKSIYAGKLSGLSDGLLGLIVPKDAESPVVLGGSDINYLASGGGIYNSQNDLISEQDLVEESSSQALDEEILPFYEYWWLKIDGIKFGKITSGDSVNFEPGRDIDLSFATDDTLRISVEEELDDIKSIYFKNDSYIAINNGGLQINTDNNQILTGSSVYIAGGQDLYIGGVGLNDIGTNSTTSGSYLVGIFDEFENSSSTNVQDVIDDIDTAIGDRLYTYNYFINDGESITDSLDSLDYTVNNILAGGSGVWTLNGSDLYATSTTYVVGVGVTDPSAKLHVLSTGEQVRLAYDNSNYSSLAVDAAGGLTWSQTGSGGDINFVSSLVAGNTTDSAFDIKTSADLGSADELFQVGDSAGDFFTILGNGNVGIGTTNPNYTLHVTGAVGYESTIYAPNIGTGTDNSVVVLNSLGNLVTDEIDSRVWGSILLDDTDIGVNVQGYDEELADVAGLTPADGNIIIGNGLAFITESGNIARTSLGLGTGDSPTFSGLTATGGLIFSGLSSGDASNTSVLALDPSNNVELLDFSTIVSNSHVPVTLAGSYDYLSLSGQQITLNQIDLTTDVTGTLPISNGGTGATTLNNLIALGTHTTGNYVATIADSGGSTIQVNNSGTETADVTIGIVANSLDFAQLKDSLTLDATTAINTYSGASDVDFRIYNSDSSDESFFVDGSTGRIGIGTTGPSAAFSIGSTSQFQVNSSGAIAAATGITSSGTISFSGLGTGTDNTVVILNGSNQLTTDEIDSRVWGSTLLDDTDIGVNVQAYDAQLTDIAGLTPTDGLFIVGNGTNFVGESGSTARTSLGLGIGDSPTFTGLTLSGLTASSAVYTDGSKNLTSTPPTSGVLGYWSRTGTTLSQANANDNLSLGSGTITTTGTITSGLINGQTISSTANFTGTATFGGLITGNAGLTVTGAAASINASGTSATNIGNSTGILTLASGGASGWTNTAGNLTLSTATSGSINLTSAAPSGGTTTSAFNIKTSTNLGSSDEVLQIGDSAADFLTVLGNGNIGIGTTNPGALLQVSSTSPVLRIENSGTSLTYESVIGELQFYGNDSDSPGPGSGASIKGIVVSGGGSEGTRHGLAFYTGATTSSIERMRINSAGQIGIGTTSISAKLHSLATTEQLRLGYDASNYSSFTVSSGGDLTIAPSGSDLSVTGNLRLSGAFYDSSVSAGSSGNILTSTGTGTAWTSVSTALDGTYFKQNGNSFSALATLGTNDSFGLAFETDGTERVRIDTSGNVGIGTTDPDTKLHVGFGTSLTSATAGVTLTSTISGGDYGGSDYIATSTIGTGIRVDDGGFNSTYGGMQFNNPTVDSGLGFNFYPTYTFKGSSASNDISFWNGSVGLGITNPAAKLQVAGNIYPSANDTYNLGSNSLRWADAYLGGETLHIGTSTTDEGTISYNTTSNIFQFGTDSTTNADIAFFTDDLYLDKSTGRVGIGTTNPSAALSVGSASQFQVNSSGAIAAATGITSSGTINFSGLNASSGIYTDGSKNLTSTPPTSGTLGYWGRSGTTLSPSNSGDNIITTGSVGIGTTNPSQALDVVGNIRGQRFQSDGTYVESVSGTYTATKPVYTFNETRGLGYNSADDAVFFALNDGVPAVFDNGGDVLLGGTTANSSAVLNIRSSGLVGIGTTNPGDTLTVVPTASSGITLRESDNGNNAVKLEASATNGVIRAYSGGTENIRLNSSADSYINTGANLGIGTTAPAGKLDVTSTSNTQAALSLTNNTATTIGNGANTLGVIDLQSTSLTTGNFLNIETNALTSGKVLNITSTSTGLTTGNLANFYWDPGSATIATGDLFKLDIGSNATLTGNLFALYNQGSDVFKVSTSKVTAAVPVEFTSAGDVSFAYDAVFTNATAANIIFNSPGYIKTSSPSGNYDLTLSAANSGIVRVNDSFAVNTDSLYVDASTGFVGLGVTNPAVRLQVAGHVYPSANNTYDLGSSTLRWQDIFVGPSSAALLHIGSTTTDEATIAYNTTSNILEFDTDSTSNGDISFFTDDLYLDKSVGRIGIGTTGPTALLSLNGAGNLLSATGTTTSGTQTFFYANASGGEALDFRYSEDSNFWHFRSGGTSRPINFSMYDVSALWIATDGKVGIGTTAPAAGVDISNGLLSLTVGADSGLTTRTNSTAKYGRIGGYHYTNAEEPVGLMFYGTTSSTNTISIGGGSSLLNAATNIDFYTAANNTTTAGTARMTIDSAGRVGIGTTSPNMALDIVSGTASATTIRGSDILTDATTKQFRMVGRHYTNSEEDTAIFYTNNTSGSNILNYGGGSSSYNTVTNHRWYVAANSTTTTGTALMELTNTGLGIGTTSPTSRLEIVDTSNTNPSISFTNNTATTIGNGGNTSGVLDLQSTSLTTGNFMNIELNALTTGKGINLTSTSTGLTSGNLFFNGYWNPGSAAIATGDLFKLDLGANATVTGNLFALYNNGSSLFKVGTAKITSSVPHEFTAAGDVSFAYNAVLTNQTASAINSYGPLTITSGESFENLDLTLKAYGTGSIVVDNSDLELYTSQKLILDTNDSGDSYFAHSNSGNYVSAYADGVEVVRFNSDQTVDGNSTFDANAFDVAEYYPTIDESIEAGDVVALADIDGSEIEASYLVAKADPTENKSQVLGIVSTKPGFSMGGGSFRSEFCALVVSGEIGENQAREEQFIKTVTESLLKGEFEIEHLQGVDLNSDASKDLIATEIEALYEDYLDGNNNNIPQTRLDTIEDRIDTCKAEKQVPIALAGRVPVKVDANNGDIKAGDLLAPSSFSIGKAMKATTEGWVVGRALEDYEEGKDTVMAYVFISWYKGEDLSANLSSSANALTLDQNLKNILTVSTSTNGRKQLGVLADINSTGTITAANITSTGNLNIGLIRLGATDNSINVLGEKLYVQNSYGALDVDFFNGKLVIGTDGSLVSVARITAETLAAKEFAVLGTTDLNNDSVSTIGEGTIKSGNKEVTINNTFVKENSKVFVTATSDTNGQTLIVEGKVDGSFKVKIKDTFSSDIKFDYWIVQVE